MNARYFYKNAIAAFLRQNEDEILDGYIRQRVLLAWTRGGGATN